MVSELLEHVHLGRHPVGGHLYLLLFLHDRDQLQQFNMREVAQLHGHGFGLHRGGDGLYDWPFFFVLTLGHHGSDLDGRSFELLLVAQHSQLILVKEFNFLHCFELAHDLLKVASTLPRSPAFEELAQRFENPDCSK